MTPDTPTSHDPTYKWKVLGIVMIGTLMAALDSSIVNVSLPRIMADFGASVDDIEWVITGYMLSFATFMPLTGWLRDRMGPKALYILALIVFTVASLLCGMSWNLGSLIGSRVIQAIGGGAITPIGMSMISDAFKPHERGKALGYWGIGVIAGPALGPTLGGYLTNQVSWRSIFLINLPIGIFGILWAMKTLKHDRPTHSHHKTFDLAGFAFLTLFLVSFLLGTSKGEHEGWQSVYIVTCWILSLVGIVGFLTVEPLVKHPIMDLSLFKNKEFTASMVVTAARSVALYGGTFLLPLFLEQMMGFDEILSGMLQLPGALCIGIMMPLSAHFADRFGVRSVTLAGLFLLALYLFIYRTLDTNTSIWGVIYPTLIRGFGIGLLVAPIMATAMNAVPHNKAAAASSMLNLVQQVSGSIGIAVVGATLSLRSKFHLNIMASTLQDRTSPAVASAARSLFFQAHELGYSHADSARVASGLLTKNVVTNASVAGFEDAFLVGVTIVLVGIFSAFLMPTKAAPVSKEHMVME